MSNEIAKEAGVLRKRLEKGSFNTGELITFLTKVERTSSPSIRGKYKDERFLAQLENLDRGRARKPLYIG